MPLDDEMRATLAAINANLTHVRRRTSNARYFRFDRQAQCVIEVDRPAGVVPHSMFPYHSSAMAVPPEEVKQVQEELRRQGVLVEFDSDGRPRIDSPVQHRRLAEAMGMRTGRDGYGHTDEDGRFQATGRQSIDSQKANRSRMGRLRKELETMPDGVSESAVSAVLRKYDIEPNSENSD